MIFNGDTLDHFEGPGVHPNSDRLIAEVLETCPARCGPPELLSGNHDPAVSSTSWAYIPTSQTLIFHGDCISDCTHPSKIDDQILKVRLEQQWRKLGARPVKFIELADIYRGIQRQHFLEHPQRLEQPDTIRYLMSSIYPPIRIYHILDYWRKAPQRAAALAATFAEPVRTVVFGHTHQAGRWTVNGMTILNTGSFMPLSTPYAVILDGPKVYFEKLSVLLRAFRL